MPQPRTPTIVGHQSRPHGVLGTPRRMAAAVIATIVACGTATVLGTDGVVHLLRLRGDKAALSERAFGLLQANADLGERIVRLHADERLLENLAREKLGFVREDEIIYRFATKPPRRPPVVHRSRSRTPDEGYERHGK